MKLNPNNIKSQTFSTSFRGFDKTEVKTFLSNISDDITDLLLENENLKKELEYHKAKNSEYVRIEKNLQEVLLKTQEDSQKTLDKAKEEAEQLLAKTKIEIEQMMNDAKSKLKKLEDEIEILENRKMLLTVKLKNFISMQAHLLKLNLTSNQNNKSSQNEIKDDNSTENKQIEQYNNNEGQQ